MRILIATDGSPHSDLAVHMGACIGQVTKVELTVLTVISREPQREQASAILSRAKAILRNQAEVVKKSIRVGQPAEQILREAKAGGYELIIVGDHPRHGLSLRLIAPTTEWLIARKPCPVLIAREQACLLQRVLVCEGGCDPSLLSRLNARLAPLVAAFAELTVLHVMSQIAASPIAQDWELEAEADELIERHTPEGKMLEADLALLQPSNLKLQAKVRHGLVVEEVLVEAKSGDYDLVVIGAHQTQGWERYLLDDLAHEIISKVDRPVLVV